MNMSTRPAPTNGCMFLIQRIWKLRVAYQIDRFVYTQWLKFDRKAFVHAAVDLRLHFLHRIGFCVFFKSLSRITPNWTFSSNLVTRIMLPLNDFLHIYWIVISHTDCWQFGCQIANAVDICRCWCRIFVIWMNLRAYLRRRSMLCEAIENVSNWR